MKRLHNKHGPDPETRYEAFTGSCDGTGRMPREGTGRMPRDGIARMLRDGIARMPRDGIARMPRDGIARMPRDGTGRMPRDGIASRPRDGTGSMPRDGTVGRSRDGTARMPRDVIIKTLIRYVISHFCLITHHPGNVKIRGKTRFRWRKTMRVNRSFGPVMGEVHPAET